MLSKAAALGKNSKEDRPSSQQVEADDNDGDEPMTSDETTQKQSTGDSSAVTTMSDEPLMQSEEESTSADDVDMRFNGWQRDPERERDKILGFFVIAQQPIPRDIFHSIMSFIPAFPYYFMLRSVCSQWLYEFQEQIYANVTFLSLVDDGRPKFYFREDNQLVQFKPLGSTGKNVDLKTPHRSRHYNRTPIFQFLGSVFPNVKHLKLGLGSFVDRASFSRGVHALLPRFKQLETLDILGTSQDSFNRGYWGYDRSINSMELDVLARALPISTKNLNFIGVTLNHVRPFDSLRIFSKKGRNETDRSLFSYSSHYVHIPIEVDIQRLTMPYLHLTSNYSYFMHAPTFDEKRISEVYSEFELSIVQSESYLPSLQQSLVVSYVDYLNYMSQKEGIFLANIANVVKADTEDTMEATIDAVVREYPYFQPLLSLPKKAFQLASQTKLDASFILGNVSTALKAFELLTDPKRMKYPELVMDVNSTSQWYLSPTPSTLLSALIPNCLSDEYLTLIMTLIKDYKASMTVNGVRNYVVEAVIALNHHVMRSKLITYLLSVEPELIVLGNSEGIIDGEQKNLPLIQLFLERSNTIEPLQEIKSLVEAGASLTQVDKFGNNVIHSACTTLHVPLVKYLLSKCPENLMFERNNKGQTPIELIFSSAKSSRDLLLNHQVKFLEEIVLLPCFQNRKLQSYETSSGNLLHSALANPKIDTIKWLLENGFDANALNDKGENALFYSTTISIDKNYSYRTKSRYQRHDQIVSQYEYVDIFAQELVRAGAKIDLQNNKGETVVTSALRNNNYKLINCIIENPDISSKPLSALLGPRMQNGLNALHYVFKTMVDIADPMRGMNKKQKAFTLGNYPIARHCALLCLEHYPEMLYERSEPSEEESLKPICGLSPLQILLEATKGLPLLNDLSIKLSDIANKPIYTSKGSEVTAPIPVMYLALEVAIDIPMFDKLMTFTDNVLIRDETQETKPNLLHIAAERDVTLCQCIIKHWKKRYKNKEELSKLISQPLENDSVDGRKPRNAAIIACSLNNDEIFSILWPFTQPFAAAFDNPIQIALDNNFHQLAMSAVINHAIVPSKVQLHQIIRRCLSQHNLIAVRESKFVTLMIQCEEQQPKPSWLELMTQIPSEAVDSEELDKVKCMSTMQLVVLELASYMFGWLVRHYTDDSLLDRALKAIDPTTGDTLLHLLTSSTQGRFGNELSSILSSIMSRFRSDGAPTVLTPKLTQRTKAKLPSMALLNTEDLTKFVNIQNKTGRTCLHNVAVNSTQNILQDLLVFGANTELKDSEGKTPVELMSESLTNIVTKFLNKRDGKKPEKRKKVKEENSDTDEEYSSKPKRKRRKTTKK